MINPTRSLIRAAALSLLSITLAASIKAQGGSASPAALPGQTVAGSNEQRVTETNAASYASFAAAITATSNKTLVISNSQAVAPGQVIPATIRLKIERGGCLNAPGNYTIQTGDIDAGRYQIFCGAGQPAFTGNLPDQLFPEWFGAVGNWNGTTGTDDLPAFDKLTAAIQTPLPAHVVIAKSHYLSGTWNIDATMLLEGLGSGTGYMRPQLRFAPNTAGVVFHRFATKTGVNAGRLSDRSTIKNLRITGAQGATTHTAMIAGLILTRVTGPAFSDAGGYHGGNTITVNNSDTDAYHWMIDTFTDTDHVVLQAPRVLLIAKNGSPYLYNVIGSGNSHLSSWFVGNTVNIGGTNYTISAVNNRIQNGSNAYGRITLASNVRGLTDNTSSFICGAFSATDCYMADTAISGGTAASAIAVRPNLFHGLDSRVQIEVSNVTVDNFAGNCLNLDSSFGFAGANMNVSRVGRSVFQNCAGNGTYARGNDANQIAFESNDASNNYGSGFAEFSFLGNHYLNNHASGNFWGGFYSIQGTVNLSSWINAYEESGEPSALANAYSMVQGGVHGSGVTLAAGGAMDHSNGWTRLDSAQINAMGGGTTKPFGIGIGGSQLQPNTLLGLGAAEDIGNTAGGGTNTRLDRYPFQFGYNQLAPGWYNFYHGGSIGTNYATDQGNSIFAFSGSPAAQGGHKLWLPNGIAYIGGSFDTGLTRSAVNTLKITDGAGGRGNLEVGGLTVGGTIFSPLRTDTFASALTLDFAQGNVHTITLTGNVTRLAFIHLAAGGEYILRVAQDTSGGRTIIWSNVRWAGGTPPKLSTGARKVDIVKFISPDGVELEEVSRALDVR